MAGLTCRACGAENPEGARFCMSCGTALALRCPNCGTENPDEARFCMSCGTALDPAAPAPPPKVEASEPPPVLPEERRRVTVLFADLSGYTAVAERMDPEALKTLVDRTLRRLGSEVERYGGTVDKYIGDNVMALFGAPVAHEDDAERAIRAALDMQAAMVDINEGLEAEHGVTFALRVGVNTGDVLAGAVGDGYTVIGDAVNVASRLQSAGRPGSVTVGEGTYRATSSAVSYERLEPLTLKGKAEPVPAWEAIDLVARRPEGRAAAATEAALVGRDDELELLVSLYGRITREGRAHLVTLIGQAGVGKSRLLREFTLRLAERDEPPIVREGRCLPYGSSIVYWALGEVVRAESGIMDLDSSEVAWEKLLSRVDELLSGHDLTLKDREAVRRRAALVARLLGIAPDVDISSAEAEDPQRMRESFFSAIRTFIEAVARERPLVLVFEDIHWADHGMLDLIEHLAQWVRAPLFILCLARDDLLERRQSWGGGRRDASSIFLDPLTDDETRELVSSLLQSDENCAGAADAVVERAGGNPFFAEEMARRLLEEQGGESELPETVQALLAARLDSLEPYERRIVQQAAVVGRTFWAGALAGAAEGNGHKLGDALTALQEKDIVVPSPGGQLAGEPEFAFKHVLIRDVAYGMLPKTIRCRKHLEVGSFIEERAGDRTDEVVALLAEHYGRAAALGQETGLDRDELDPIHAKALHFLEAAGDAAAALYSNQEAFSNYQAARDLRYVSDPATLTRIGEKQGDVALRLGRVDAAISVWEECLDYHRGQEDLERVGDLHRKIGAGLWHKGERKEAIEHYQKGINLLKDGSPCLELVRLYEEAATLYMHTGDNMLAIYASEKALRLAEQLNETRAASRAHGIFGLVFGRIGDSAKARENLEKSVELARDSDQSETIRALLALGYHLENSDADYAEAEQGYGEALAIAEQLGDLPAQAELHAALGLLAGYRCDWEALERSTEASAGVAEREGLVGKLAFPYGLRGLLRWREGDWAGAERWFKRSHELADQIGWSEIAFSSLFGLAMTLRDRGDHAASITALDQALDVCERAGLVAQSIQAMAARAVTLSLAGKAAQGRDAAEEASHLAERLPYPVGRAAALEAMGATAADPEEAARTLREAATVWRELGRPGEAARCELLVGRVMRDHDPEAARAALEAAAAEFERLGVPHTLERARQFAAE